MELSVTGKFSTNNPIKLTLSIMICLKKMFLGGIHYLLVILRIFDEHDQIIWELYFL